MTFFAAFVLISGAWRTDAATVNSRTADGKEIVLKARAVIADKVWNTSTSRDQNYHGKTDTYYYPWKGDDKAFVKEVVFVDLTEAQKKLIADYGIHISCNPSEDIQSAAIDMNFIGERPVTIDWKKAPTLMIDKAQEAEADGYIFSLTLQDPVCQVLDNGDEGITRDEYQAYYDKAKKACQVILKNCQDHGSFGNKDNPDFLNTDLWAIVTAARCGYQPYQDQEYFIKWYENTAAYIRENENLVKDWSATVTAKAALAIEAIGYDPRNVNGVNLLYYVGQRKGSDWYATEYAIHAIKAGQYQVSSFTNEEMDKWAHDRARTLLNVKESSLKNPDNTMSWQPLIYWYDQEGFEDVTKAVDQAIIRLPQVAQRATGAFCTEGFETACATYANNPWNNAQTLIFASIADVNVMDPATGYTKNGNNILDAMFVHVDFETGDIPGLTYDPPQIARAFNAFTRMYERTVLGKDCKHYWDFTDAGGREEQILIERAGSLIDAIPDVDKLSLNDKGTVEKAARAYDALTDAQKAMVSQEHTDKLRKAREIIICLEKKKKADQEAKKQAIIKGSRFKTGGGFYKVLSRTSVSYTGPVSKSVTKITIPATVIYKKKKLAVTAIESKACKGCRKLKKLVIGSKVITIGAKAFYGDKKLKKITIQSPALKKVGANAFKGIYKKAVIKVPKKKKKVYKKLLKGKGQKKTVKIK